MPVYPYRDILPRLGTGCFVAPGAHVIGDVELGDDVSVWFGTVIRGDVFHIRIGSGTNIQDNSVIHVTTDRFPTVIGKNVTIGHQAMLHGCTVKDGALIGMGAIIMDRVVVGENALVAAGSLVTEGTIIPDNTLVMGSPAKPRRELTESERKHLQWSAPHYVNVSRNYIESIGAGY